MALHFPQDTSLPEQLDHIKKCSVKPFRKQSYGRIEGALKRAYSKYWDWALEERLPPVKKSTSKLQFFCEPVPGIYCCEGGSKFRKLVYVKGNQKKDVEGLFRKLEGFNVEPKKEFKETFRYSESFNINETSEDSDNQTSSAKNNDANIDQVCGSNECFTIDDALEYNSKNSTRFYGLLDVAISPSDNIWLPLLPLEPQTKTQEFSTQLSPQNSISTTSLLSQASTRHTPWHSSSTSSRDTTPMTSTNPSISDHSIFSNISAISSATSLSSTPSITPNKEIKPNQIHTTTTPSTPWKPKPPHTTPVCKKSSSNSKGIGTCDLSGYRELLNPLQVEYQPVVGRWMFTSEIALRTTEAKIIKPSTPKYACNPAYHGGKRYRLFALDDGKSWVVTGKWVEERFYERKVRMGDVKKGNKKGYLFSAMNNERMRMQGREEREGSLERFGREKRGFLVDEEWVMDFEGVVRFLGL